MAALDPALLDLELPVRDGSGGFSERQSNGSNHSGGTPNAGDALSAQIEHGDRQVRLANANFKNRAAQKRYRERQKGKMETYKQQVDELSSRLGQLQAENASLEQRNRLLERVVSMKDARPAAASPAPEASPAEGGPWPGVDTHAALAEYVNAVRRQRQPALAPADAARISPEDLRQVRQDYVREVAVLMLACADGSDADKARELEDYVLQNRLAVLGLLNSMSVRAFAHIVGLKRRLIATSSISRRLMAALRLTPDQTRDLLAARGALLQRNEHIKQKRCRILAELQRAVPSVASVMCGQTSAMLRACDSSDQFKASLEEEHRSIAQFHIDCTQVFTPMQEVRSLLEAHPGSPDSWLITGYLEAEQSGCLDAWLAEHGSEQALHGLDSPGPGSSAVKPEPFASAFAAGPFPSAALLPGDGLLAAADGAPLEALPLSLGMPPALPDMLPTPSMTADLDAMADDMWLDMFPGILTQAQT